MPRLCGFYPGICLTTEEKARKYLSQGSRRMPIGSFVYTCDKFYVCYLSCPVHLPSFHDTNVLRRQQCTKPLFMYLSLFQCCYWVFFPGASDSSMCPGVDSASKNEYQDIPGGKDGRCVRVTTLPPSCAKCLEILEF